jgi:outer membrane protein OmpA-like peptidoglycan-associated protein
LRPIPVKYIEGYVYDSLTKDRLNYAQIFLLRAGTEDTLFQFQSNRGDGSFMITLPAGGFYEMRTARTGYTDVIDTFTLDMKELDKTVNKTVVMLPFDYQEIKPINDTVVATLHFDAYKVDLSAEEKRMLHEAMSPWMDEKGIVVYVSAYTDNSGSPMVNEELSYKRANLVTRELVSIGIDEVGIVSKGYGESKMIAPNDTEEGRHRNRRVEVMIRR